MLNIPTDSFRFRIVAGVFTIMLLLMVLVVINNIYAISVIRNQAYESNKNTMSMYISHIDSGFSDVEKYLAGYASNNSNIMSIENPTREIDRHTAIYREEQKLSQTLAGYNMIDGLFIFSKPESFFINIVQPRINIKKQQNIKTYFKNLLNVDDSIIGNNPGQWFYFEDNNDFHLCRIIKIQNTYIGAWVKTSTLISNFEKTGFNTADYIFFANGKGFPLDANLLSNNINISGCEKVCTLTIEDKKSDFLVVSQPSIHGKYKLTSLVLENNVLEQLGNFRPILYIVIIGMIFSLLLLGLTLNKYMIKPINSLVEAIESLKSGNLDAQIKEKHPCREFNEVNQAFHDMTGQIKHLKIDVYEEKLLRQKLQLQHLQKQVAPHFLINCLSTIYSLANANKNKLVKEISMNLSSHLRYAISNLEYVSVKNEIEHVINYIKLSQLRFPNSINYSIQVDEKVHDGKIPALTIQTFVENTIKHEVVVGELLTINIHIQKKFIQNKAFLEIEIWDTGDGFSKKILNKLNNSTWKSEENGSKIGLYNIMQRMKLIYDNDAIISFKNRKNAGAQIDITVPYISIKEGEKN